QGADVIKIEPLDGDTTRRTAKTGEFTPTFVSANRGKRSLALDLKQSTAIDLVRRLVAGADVLVQNFRPGTMERLGLDEPTLRALNPRLVYVSISGVGETGPYAKKRVYDPIIQSLSGLADVQADQATGRPRMVRAIVADKATAVHAAQAVCAALFARERSGQGQHVRLSMLDTLVAFIWPESMTQYTVIGREGAGANPTARPDLVFETQDGYITVGSVSDAEWKGLADVIGKPEWIDDARFRTPALRSVNAAERITLVGEVLKTNTSRHWLERLDAADVPCAPILARSQVAADPQVVHNGLIVTFDQPGLGPVRQPRPAARFERTPAAIGGPAPAIGEHTDQILGALGLCADEIAALKASKAVKAAAANPAPAA
ncbi:MAG: CaiB/BaiF CoA transferase family protein, partial [Burkholderiales bacterium]